MIALGLNAPAVALPDDDEDEPAISAPAPTVEVGLTPIMGAAAPPVDGARSDPPSAERSVRLIAGMGPYAYPRYPGSRRMTIGPYPLIEASVGNWLALDTLDSLRLTAFERNGLSLGFAARYRFGRQVGDDPGQLRGLRNIHDTVEAGGFINYRLGAVALDLIVTQDIAHAHRGLVGDLSLYHSIEIGPVEIEYGPYVRGASRAFNQSFFGISPQEAAINGRSAYRAGGGLNRAGLSAVAALPITARLQLIVDLEYGHLLGRPEGSSLVRQGGSPEQLFAGIFLAWRF